MTSATKEYFTFTINMQQKKKYVKLKLDDNIQTTGKEG